MNRFRQFMYGRYGFDQYSQALIVTSLLISLISTFIRIEMLAFISYIPFIYAIYRILSKDINKRRKENYKFTMLVNSVKNIFKKSTLKATGTKTHKYYTCPKCKTTIRVPKGKGRIRITCPKCRAEFIKRT